MKKQAIIILTMIVFFQLSILYTVKSESDGLILQQIFWNTYGIISDVHPSDSSGYYSAIGTNILTNGTSYRITTIKITLLKQGSPSGYLRAVIYNSSGTKPNSEILAYSSDLAMSTVTTSSVLYNFTFTGSNSIFLNASSNYFIAIIAYNATTLNGSHYIKVDLQNSNVYSNGAYYYFNNGVWSNSGASTYDVSFYIYGTTIPLYGLTFNSQTYSNNVKDENTTINFNLTSTYCGIYKSILEHNITGTFTNETQEIFSNQTNVLTSNNILVNSSLGNIIQYRLFVLTNVSNWYVSSNYTFQVGVRLTFYHSEGGLFFVNNYLNSLVSNGTSIIVNNTSQLRLSAIENSTFAFKSFNWTNSINSTTENYYSFTPYNNTEIFAYMNYTIISSPSSTVSPSPTVSSTPNEGYVTITERDEYILLAIILTVFVCGILLYSFSKK